MLSGKLLDTHIDVFKKGRLHFKLKSVKQNRRNIDYADLRFIQAIITQYVYLQT